MNDLNQLDRLVKKKKEVEKDLYPYLNIETNADELCYGFFIEGTKQREAAKLIVNQCFLDGNLNAFEKMKHDYPDFVKKNASNWELFEKKLNKVINEPDINPEEMGEYKKLLNRFVSNETGFYEEKSAKKNNLLSAKVELSEFSSQQNERYARFSEGEKKYIQIRHLMYDIKDKPGFEMENLWLSKNYNANGAEDISKFVENAEAYFKGKAPELLEKYQQISPSESLKVLSLPSDVIFERAATGRKPYSDGVYIGAEAKQLKALEKINKAEKEISQKQVVNMMGLKSR